MFCEEDAGLQFTVILTVVVIVYGYAGDEVIPLGPGGGVEEGSEDEGGGGGDGGCCADGEGGGGLGAPVGSGEGGEEGGCYGGLVWEGCWRGHGGDGEAGKGDIVGDEVSGD